ncbi:PAS domain-containing sensor histidine kinase [Pseudochryseolinea flava]|uniref:histidine kinase n=1 Tax=Pseudochryseolinea flava TaxID=2059302 RepID=A0A364XX87_9BACT|nr:PAS domain-containing protein [Pseudochryseolinea flava]RAV98150.1 hypothetical protein DQQ10_25115 [Pseudochryseolinea flava]
MTPDIIPPESDAAKAILQVDMLKQLSLAEQQRHALQHELDTLKERFRYLHQATQDAVWEWDLLKNVGWYGDGLHQLFGYTPETLGDGIQFWYNSIHPSDKDRVLNGIHAVIDSGEKNWRDRYRFKRADDSYAWVLDRGYVIHDAAGVAVKMIGSMQDVTVEIEAKEALRESEEKFRGAFDQLAVGISIADPSGNFLSVNKAYPNIFGYSEAELTSKKISDLSHPDELEGDRRIIQDLLSGRQQMVAREKRYIHQSGKIIWGRVFGTVIYDAYGKPKYIVGVLEDITEQRQVVQALRANEERLRLVIDAAKIGTWNYDPLTGIVMWDDRCKAMFGMRPEDPIDYAEFLLRVHPEDRERADRANQNAIKGLDNGEYDLEYRTIGKYDQKIRWVRAKGRSYKDETGTTVLYTGTTIDITEEKERTQKLQEQEERFRLLATSIPQIVWTTDEHGIVDYMSEKWVQYTGHVPTYEKFSFRTLMHPDDLERVIPAWNECMRKGITFRMEYRLRNIHTNEYRWFDCTTAPLMGQQGKVVKWIGSATDVHDQKMVELHLEQKVAERTKELVQSNQQLEKSNAELEQYAYVTSHDLKEPLRKIRTYSNLITTKFHSQLAPDVQHYFTKIESASFRMTALIDDLLKYSQLSTTETPFIEVDMNEIVARIAAEFDDTLKQKEITIDVAPLPTLQAIPIHLHQLFLNLFSNAIKFSKQDIPNNITITSSLLSAEEKNSYPSLTNAGDHYKIQFKDNGIGFSQQYAEQVFNIFQRLHNRKDFEGHGIGLALCRKIVHNHHGVISVTSEEQKGATFTIILPSGQ